MSILKNTIRAKCPVCGYKFPLLNRIFMNTVRGHICPKCGSVLVQSTISIATQYILLFLSIILFISFIKNCFSYNEYCYYFIYWVTSFFLLVIVKLRTKLLASGHPYKKCP